MKRLVSLLRGFEKKINHIQKFNGGLK